MIATSIDLKAKSNICIKQNVFVELDSLRARYEKLDTVMADKLIDLRAEIK